MLSHSPFKFLFLQPQCLKKNIYYCTKEVPYKKVDISLPFSMTQIQSIIILKGKLLYRTSLIRFPFLAPLPYETYLSFPQCSKSVYFCIVILEADTWAAAEDFNLQLRTLPALLARDDKCLFIFFLQIVNRL